MLRVIHDHNPNDQRFSLPSAPSPATIPGFNREAPGISLLLRDLGLPFNRNNNLDYLQMNIEPYCSPDPQRSELGNHDCEYDSDGAPCNHCGRTAAEAIAYFERNLNKSQRSEQQEWTPFGKFGINVGADTFTPQCYDTGSRDIILNAHNAALAAEQKQVRILTGALGQVHDKLAAERRRHKQAEQSKTYWTPKEELKHTLLGDGCIGAEADTGEQQEWTPKRVASYLAPDYAERLSADFSETLAAERQFREQAEQQILNREQRWEEIEKLYKFNLVQLLSALAAIDHHCIEWSECDGKIDIDFSALHQHDAELWRILIDGKPRAICKHCGYPELIGSDDCRNCGKNFNERIKFGEKHDAEVRKPLVDLLEDVIAQSVDASTYPDGPCLPKDLRDEIKDALAKVK